MTLLFLVQETPFLLPFIDKHRNYLLYLKKQANNHHKNAVDFFSIS